MGFLLFRTVFLTGSSWVPPRFTFLFHLPGSLLVDSPRVCNICFASRVGSYWIPRVFTFISFGLPAPMCERMPIFGLPDVICAIVVFLCAVDTLYLFGVSPYST